MATTPTVFKPSALADAAPQGAGGAPVDLTKLVLLSALLILLVWAVYYPCLRFPFISYDDPMYVAQNAVVKHGLAPEGLQYAFTSLRGFWQPVLWLFYMAVAQFLGTGPAGFHFANVSLHAANAVMLLLIAWRVSNGLPMSFMLAALWAVHPSNVESVAWVSEAKGLLAAFFALACTLVYLRHSRQPSTKTYAALIVTFTLGVLAKPSIVCLPLLFLAWDVLSPGGGFRIDRKHLLKPLAQKAPLLVISAAVCAMDYAAEKTFGAVKTGVSVVARLSNATVAAAHYLGQTMYPTNLAVFYPAPAHVNVLKTALAGTLVAAILVCFGLRGKPAVLMIAGFFLLLLPQLGLIQIGNHARADRYLYLPLIFSLAMVLSLFAPMLAPRHPSPALGLACAALLLSLGLSARSNVLCWRSDKALFTHALQATSADNVVAQITLGLLALNRGQYDEAITRLSRAARLAPASLVAHYDLALAYTGAGQQEAAETEYKAALKLNPRDTATLVGYAELLSGKGRAFAGRARGLAWRAIRGNYRSARAYDALAHSYFEAGDTNKAFAVWHLASRLNNVHHDE
jgi:protein O-mannosyl-transferase